MLGIVLGISDLCYANYYRDMARSEDVQGGKTTWTVGHWGWQWYAEQVGMRSFGTTTSRIANGDLLIMPMNIDRQRLELPFDVDLHVVDKRWRGSDARTFVSVKNFASLYNSSVTKPVWNFSRLPIDTIYVYRIDIGREAAIRKAVRAILSDKDWSRIVREKARSANVPVDTMLRRDAIFVLAQDHPQGHEGNR